MRDDIIQLLIREVIGPDPKPEYLDETTGEEMLLERVHGSPKSRYGSGMLYPQASHHAEAITGEEDGVESEDDSEVVSESEDSERQNRGSGISDDSSTEETIGLANEFLPSAMGFTARYSVQPGAALKINVHTAWYERMPDTRPEKVFNPKTGNVEEKRNPATNEIVNRNYWIRRPIHIEPIDLELGQLQGRRGKVYEHEILANPVSSEKWLNLEVFNRSTQKDTEENCVTLTISLINCSIAGKDHRISDQSILFQNRLKVESVPGIFTPFREKISGTDTVEEDELRLLYRDQKTFAIGHGCSVVWEAETEEPGFVCTSFLPEFEVPPVNPTSSVEISMYELSDEGNWQKGIESLNRMVDEYATWITDMEKDIQSLPAEYYSAANRNLQKCSDNLDRIKAGVELLASTAVYSAEVRSFRWMNRAMIWQQQRSKQFFAKHRRY